MRIRTLAFLALPALLAVPAGAGAQDPSPSPIDWGASCAVPASPVPQATPDCGPDGTQGSDGPSGPVAVIDVSGEVYRIALTTPDALAGAQALLAGTSAAAIPNGTVVRDDPGPNAPWSWHIDPATLTWAEMTTEVCDGRPTQLQDGVFTYGSFCPWSAVLLGIEHDPEGGTVAPGDPVTLPLEWSGGTSSEDRTFAQRLPLDAGSYVLAISTGPNLDPTVSGCGAEIRLLTADGAPALGSTTAYPTIQPDDRAEIAWPDVPAGAYDLFVSFDCAWAISFGPATSSAS